MRYFDRRAAIISPMAFATGPASSSRHQSELELHAKLQNEVGAERLTRLDKMPLSEQHEQGVIDLRPGEGAIWLVPASSSREVLRKDCPAMKSLGWASCLCAPLA